MNHDHWSLQNDPMVSSDYGLPFLLAVPLVAGLVGGGVAAGGALRRYAARTNVNDIARMAANEGKKTSSLANSRAETVPNAMFQGAAPTKEAGFIAAFWLYRVARVAQGQGRSGAAARLREDARRTYATAARQIIGGSDDAGEIAAVFAKASRAVASSDTSVETTLLNLGRVSSTRSRKGLVAETGPETTLLAPVKQTATDVGETAEDIKQGAGWFTRNAIWLVPTIGIGYLAVVLLASRAPRAQTRGRSRRA